MWWLWWWWWWLADSHFITKEVIVGLHLCATRGGLVLGPFLGIIFVNDEIIFGELRLPGDKPDPGAWPHC